MDQKVSPAELQQYLKGVSYPTSKDDLVSKARENGAPENVVNMIQGMAQEMFNGQQEIMKAYGAMAQE